MTKQIHNKHVLKSAQSKAEPGPDGNTGGIFTTVSHIQVSLSMALKELSAALEKVFKQQQEILNQEKEYRWLQDDYHDLQERYENSITQGLELIQDGEEKDVYIYELENQLRDASSTTERATGEPYADKMNQYVEIPREVADVQIVGSDEASSID